MQEIFISVGSRPKGYARMFAWRLSQGKIPCLSVKIQFCEAYLT